MCKQRIVVEKIIEHNEVNGFGVELAKAQMEDYVAMNKKITRVEKDVSLIKKEQKRQGEILARQDGKIDMIVQYINSPAEDERKDGLVWREIKRFVSTPLGRAIILLCMFCLGLSGQRIMELTGIIS